MEKTCMIIVVFTLLSFSSLNVNGLNCFECFNGCGDPFSNNTSDYDLCFTPDNMGSACIVS